MTADREDASTTQADPTTAPSSPRLLAVCENPLEVQSIVPVARELERQSDHRIRVDFASQDPLLSQGADAALQKADRSKRDLPYPVQLSRPFHDLGSREKLKVMLETERSLRSVMDAYDGLMYGIDDLAARMLAAEAYRRGIPTFQIFVSLNLGDASEKSVGRRLKDGLRAVVGYVTGASFLTFPNRPAGSPCDRLFVMGERNKEAFVEQGVPPERVFVHGMPRFANLFDRDPSSDRERPEQSRILYVTGSFAWHGETEGHHLQQRQLHQIVDVLEEQPAATRPEFALKVHPREDAGYYDWMRDREVVTVIPAEEDLYPCIQRSTAVASICSTVAYEAVLQDRISILTRFPQPVDLPLGKMHEDFVEVKSAKGFLDLVAGLDERPDVYDDMLARQRRNAERVIDPDTPRSAKLIAENIRRYLAN
jgi:hypothetical protein